MTPRRCLPAPSGLPFGRLALLLVLGLLGLAAGSPEPARAATESRRISLNVQRTGIDEIVKQVGEATGRTILFDEQVRGMVSIVAKRPVELDEAWSILDASLSMLGYSLLPSTEGTWRIAPVAEAVGEAPFQTAEVRSVGEAEDRFVTALIPLRVADPEAVLDVLSPLAGSRVTLVPFARTHSLIASGPERAIARLTTIADELDRIEQKALRFRVLRHRDVDEVEAWVERFLEADLLSSRELEAWSDARTNSFVYRGSPEQAERFARLLDRLDRPVDDGGGQVRVMKVLHRDAADVAELILSLSESGAAQPGRAAGLPIGASAGEATTTILEENEYSIAVDEATRSLVVQAAPEVQEAIREMLEILDQPPQLIAVDIKVTQVLTPSRFTLGAALNVPLSPGDDLDEVVARLISNPGGAGLLAQPNAQTPLFARVTRDAGIPFTLGGDDGVEIPIDDTGVIDAGDFTARTEVLIEPSLVLTAGDRHEIFVGDNLPVPVTGDAGLVEAVNVTGAVLSRQTNIERRDVGTLLGIEARAGKVGKIQLDLEIELSQLSPSLAGDITSVGPTFTERSLTVTARLDDGDVATIALGEETQTTRVRTGVPWLSRLPFIGWLFGRWVDDVQDSRLAISVRARRVGSPAERVLHSIRRRLAFERRNARDREMPSISATGSPFAVLVTTRRQEEDARAISEGLIRRGYASQVHRWSHDGATLFDVYVTALDSMAAAAEVAAGLAEDGWAADLIVLPVRS